MIPDRVPITIEFSGSNIRVVEMLTSKRICSIPLKTRWYRYLPFDLDKVYGKDGWVIQNCGLFGSAVDFLVSRQVWKETT